MIVEQMHMSKFRPIFSMIFHLGNTALLTRFGLRKQNLAPRMFIRQQSRTSGEEVYENAESFRKGHPEVDNPDNFYDVPYG